MCKQLAPSLTASSQGKFVNQKAPNVKGDEKKKY